MAQIHKSDFILINEKTSVKYNKK